MLKKRYKLFFATYVLLLPLVQFPVYSQEVAVGFEKNKRAQAYKGVDDEALRNILQVAMDKEAELEEQKVKVDELLVELDKMSDCHKKGILYSKDTGECIASNNTAANNYVPISMENMPSTVLFGSCKEEIIKGGGTKFYSAKSPAKSSSSGDKCECGTGFSIIFLGYEIKETCTGWMLSNKTCTTDRAFRNYICIKD